MLASEEQTTTTTIVSSTTKSPDILFARGLSVFLDPFQPNLDGVKTETPAATIQTTTNLDLNNSEKTYDLADYLYQNNQKTGTTLTQLEPVRPATPVHLQQQLQQQEMIDHNHNHKLVQNVIVMNECSMDSSCSSSSKEVVTPKPNKRGRKPASAATVQLGSRTKFGKHELVDDNKTKTLVYFGNKKVEIGTDEYQKRRKNNNEAVKKCRQKMEQEQKEREDKMQKLMDENRRLNEKVNTMGKEMEVLKGIIISMKPDNTLPDFIQKPMNDL